MASVALSSKAVGSTVKLNVNGVAKDFIIVHQGLPSSLYDSSCNGTWLLMKDVYEKRQWHSSRVNDYANSTIHSYLNSTFLNLFDADIKAQIKQAKIPYRPGSGTSGTINSGASGLSAKIFLLSGYELGCNTNNRIPADGATLAYFSAGNGTTANSKRIANLNGSALAWWMRSPYISNKDYASNISTSGQYTAGSLCDTSTLGVRPALILPSNLMVADNGTIITNTPPTISSPSGGSGVNLGSKTAAFSFQYTPSDADGDKLTVTEKLDGVVKKTRTNVTSGTALTFECASTAAEFQKITNGSHTVTIEVSDGQAKATFTAAFTKAVHEASITLKTPLAVAGDITAAVMSVTGDIPADAVYKVEVTNNAKDSSPVWQDVTSEVKTGANIVYTNKTAVNGAAFNFRITVKRGASNTGGYISVVTGAFQ